MTIPKRIQTQNARGYRDEHGRVQIAVRLDPKSFEELKVQAVKDKMSIAQKIRDYIHLGLDADLYAEEECENKPDITTFEGVS